MTSGNTATFHVSMKGARFTGWTEFSEGYDGPAVTVTYLPPPLTDAGRAILDGLRAGTPPDGPEHVHIAAAVGEHAVLIPAGADVTVVANCGGGSGP